MTTWFTSDLHIGHSNILKFCTDRPGDNVHGMNLILIENILNSVSKGDTLFIVGDVVMGIREENLQKLVPIRDSGVSIHLISGNHDYSHPIGHKRSGEFVKLYRVFFDSVHTELRLESGASRFVLNHFPLTADHPGEERFNAPEIDIHRPKLKGGEILIHGHLHTGSNFTSDREIHVGVDSDWTEFGVPRHHPVPMNAIIELVDSIGIR